MALASDLMGLGLPPLLALKIAQAGVGPVTITAAGTTYAGSTKIGVDQTLVGCSNGNNTLSIGLPVVGGDNGASIGDEFVVANTGTTDTVVLRASTGVLINASTQDSVFALGPGKAISIFPFSSTLWCPVKGA
jgi:hypothetical protein